VNWKAATDAVQPLAEPTTSGTTKLRGQAAGKQTGNAVPPREGVPGKRVSPVYAIGTVDGVDKTGGLAFRRRWQGERRGMAGKLNGRRRARTSLWRLQWRSDERRPKPTQSRPPQNAPARPLQIAGA
jgi:hypothetical protein